MSPIGSRLSHRRQQMWVYIIAGLFACDFVLCGYLPSQQRLTSLQQVRAQQRTTIAMAAAQSVELSGLERRLRDMETAVDEFDRRVPADRALGTFLQQIAGIMEECRLVDQVVLPGQGSKTGVLNCVPIHVACKGTLRDLFGFFTKLQSLGRLVRIEKVIMENDADWTGQISARVDAVIFEQAVKPHKTNGSTETKPGEDMNDGR